MSNKLRSSIRNFNNTGAALPKVMVRLVILRSKNGKDHWELLDPEAIPDFISKDEDIQRRMANGEMARNFSKEISAQDRGYWFLAVHTDQLQRLLTTGQLHCINPQKANTKIVMPENSKVEH